MLDILARNRSPMLAAGAALAAICAMTLTSVPATAQDIILRNNTDANQDARRDRRDNRDGETRRGQRGEGRREGRRNRDGNGNRSARRERSGDNANARRRPVQGAATNAQRGERRQENSRRRAQERRREARRDRRRDRRIDRARRAPNVIYLDDDLRPRNRRGYRERRGYGGRYRTGRRAFCEAEARRGRGRGRTILGVEGVGYGRGACREALAECMFELRRLKNRGRFPRAACVVTRSNF